MYLGLNLVVLYLIGSALPQYEWVRIQHRSNGALTQYAGAGQADAPCGFDDRQYLLLFACNRQHLTFVCGSLHVE